MSNTYPGERLLIRYFNNVDSKGPFLTEQENGPDKYVDNVRQDAFERFHGLIKHVEDEKDVP